VGIETPCGTVRYSSNFDEATSSRPRSRIEAPPVNQLFAPGSGASWAKSGMLVASKPQARATQTIWVRFMAYLTKNAPDGWLEPWILTWHIRQLRSMNRELTVG
jgi:hypothetical protein